MKCEKRQRVVKRGIETFRCINAACDMRGEQVTDDICQRCRGAVVFKPRPCNKIAPCEDCGKKEKELIKAPEYPALLIQLISWKEAIRKWRAAGKPTRTDTEVADIKNRFCNEGCSWFDPAKNRCKGCGCKVPSGGVAVLNKIRMATEHCPRDLW